MNSARMHLYALLIAGIVAIMIPATGTMGSAASPAAEAAAPASSLNELEDYFQKAKGYLEKKAYPDAASQIRKATTFIKREAEQATAR